jgi:hypothetical protein
MNKKGKFFHALFYQVNSSSVNRIQQTLPPPVQINNVIFQLISFPVNILKVAQVEYTRL